MNKIRNETRNGEEGEGTEKEGGGTKGVREEKRNKGRARRTANYSVLSNRTK